MAKKKTDVTEDASLNENKCTTAVIMDELSLPVNETTAEIADDLILRVDLPVKKAAIGVKLVKFWPQVKDDKAGYGIEYQDGYVSWCPKDVFDRAYLPIEENTEQEILKSVCKSLVVPNAVCATHFTQIIKGWIDNGIIQK